jgi:uncharacterized protein (TIGR02145 family)
LKEGPYFAGSNIYWDATLNSGAGGMTFDQTDLGRTSIQGVFFLWGSLVGIRPQVHIATNSHILYIPNVSNKTWDATKGYNDSSLPWGMGWESIPEMNVMNSGSSSENYLYNHPAFSDYKGDICSYLTEGSWRMPNLDEFGSTSKYNRNYTSISPSTTSAADTTSMGSAGVTYATASGSVFFPASGTRIAGGNGSASSIGQQGYYWSGSSGSTANTCRFLYFSSGSLTMSSGTPNRQANPVRCVKN